VRHRVWRGFLWSTRRQRDKQKRRRGREDGKEERTEREREGEKKSEAEDGCIGRTDACQSSPHVSLSLSLSLSLVCS
jgi:hypothetical protein